MTFSLSVKRPSLREFNTLKFLGAYGLILVMFAPGVTVAAEIFGGSSNEARTFSWSKSYTVLGTSLNATEGRQFTTINPYTASAALLWATGNFGTTATSNKDATVFILNKPEKRGGEWAVDTTFSDSCTTEGQPHCFTTVNVMQSIAFTEDSSGTAVLAAIPVAAPIYQPMLSNSCAGTMIPEYSEQRNNTDGVWYGSMIGCAPPPPPQIRSYSWTAHTDTITGAQYAFIGGDPNGIVNGQLNPNWASAGVNPIAWNTSSSEWTQSSYSGPPCTAPRVMGFAELAGADGVARAYASICYQIFVRIDGPQSTCTAQEVVVNRRCVPRWQVYWTAQAVNGGSGNGNGMRGLTAAQPEGIMLSGYQGRNSATAGQDEHIWSIPPLCPATNTGCSDGGNSCADYSATTGLVTLTNISCATSELSVKSTAPTAQSITGLRWGTAVIPWNRFIPFYNSNGVLQYYVPFSILVDGPDTPPQSTWSYMISGYERSLKWADATHFIRASTGHYKLVVEPELFTQPQYATRDITVSPWASECTYNLRRNHYENCAIYTTGFDNAARANEYYWCLPDGTPCPSSPTLTLANQTAWIARYGP
jgi:hypothetical protein